jgi:3-deoxy-D-manno-octulosonic-acid transferase
VIPSLTKTPEVDLFVPMPWDTPREWQKFLDHYKPRVLGISRTDTWPNLVWQSHQKHIPSILFSATLPRQSARVSNFWGRHFYARIFKDLTRISCVSEEDKNNFLLLSKTLPVTVDGDTRFDQAITRVEERRALPPWTAQLKGPVFLAGSTWPEDEKELIPALETVAKEISFKAIIAPHEPSESHLLSLEKRLSECGLKSERLSKVAESYVPQIILVDKVGILADLYRLGQVAFVGGSFKKSVHSVMEPAASGCRTFFGPYHHNNREALALKTQNLAFEVLNQKDIEKILKDSFLMSAEQIAEQKRRILSAVHANRGVSQKIASWIVENLGPTSPVSLE